jgi:hypothetical protein
LGSQRRIRSLLRIDRSVQGGRSGSSPEYASGDLVRRKFILLLILFVLAVANASAATNHYYISTAGSDSHDCSASDSGHACLTVQHVIEMFTLGSTGAVIHVAAGTYTDTLLDSSLTPACAGWHVWFCANFGGTSDSVRLTIQCDAPNYGCLIRPGGTPDGIADYQASYVTLTGFDAGNISAGLFGIVGYSGTNDSFVGNFFHDIGQTNPGYLGQTGCPAEAMIVAVAAAANWTVAQNKIIHFGDDTIYCAFAHGVYLSNAPTIQNNIISRVPGWGVQLSAADCNAVITNNVIFDNREGGIVTDGSGAGCSVGSAGRNTITNNIIAYNGVYANHTAAGQHYAIKAYDTEASNLIANNIWYGNSPTDTCDGCIGTITGNITSEAPSTTFVNFQDDGSGDYHLKAGSLAIKGGTTSGAGSPGCVSACSPTVDFAGATRSSPPDIGAYLYSNSSSPSAGMLLSAEKMP